MRDKGTTTVSIKPVPADGFHDNPHQHALFAALRFKVFAQPWTVSPLPVAC